jgi:hypothetical protein
VQRAGNDAVPLAVAIRAQVHEEGAALESGRSIGRREALDARFRPGEEILERPGPAVHEGMMPLEVALVGLSS